jgi:transposase-like protein
MSLASEVTRFDSEQKCRSYLERLRWPDGVSCPRCDASRGISRIRQRGQFHCDTCGYQFSVRVGTIFQDSRLPLWKWFLAVYIICEAENGISANQLKEIIGVSYKTAWYLLHRIRAAMKQQHLEPVALVGPYQHLSAKHLPAYIDEIAFRDSNRDNDNLFIDVLSRLLAERPMRYAELVSTG